MGKRTHEERQGAPKPRSSAAPRTIPVNTLALPLELGCWRPTRTRSGSRAGPGQRVGRAFSALLLVTLITTGIVAISAPGVRRSVIVRTLPGAERSVERAITNLGGRIEGVAHL